MVRPVWYLAYFSSAWVGGTLTFNYKIEGEPIEKGPVLIIGKHVSNWDIPMLSRAVRRRIHVYPHFEMGSFHGYPILGKVITILKWCGGFPVMRSKDLLRLRHTSGKSKEELRDLMREVNEEAAQTRFNVLRERQAMCFFPEGTRDKAKLNRLRSIHEVEEALKLRDEGLDIKIVALVGNYGPKPKSFFKRQDLTVKVMRPFDLEGKTARDILNECQELFEEHWVSGEPQPEA